jgi:hypothetical protein
LFSNGIIDLCTDNGKEFVATVVVQMLKAHNPNCFVITGRPRTPRDQGSVENANKLIQRVLKSISAERRLKGLEVNWTNLLGQVMSICNSQCGIRSLSTSSYQAVFGLQYHPVLQCTTSEMRECKNIFQALKLSPDDRLEKYVRDNDIVPIADDDVRGSDVQLEEDIDDVDDDEDEGEDINDDTFPDCDVEELLLCRVIEDDDKLGGVIEEGKYLVSVDDKLEMDLEDNINNGDKIDKLEPDLEDIVNTLETDLEDIVNTGMDTGFDVFDNSGVVAGYQTSACVCNGNCLANPHNGK